MKSVLKSYVISIFFLLIMPHVFGQEIKHEETDEIDKSNRPIYKLDSQTTWPFISLLNDAGDDASTLGIEFESTLKVGKYNIKNISYFEVNQFPRPIPSRKRNNTFFRCSIL